MDDERQNCVLVPSREGAAQLASQGANMNSIYASTDRLSTVRNRSRDAAGVEAVEAAEDAKALALLEVVHAYLRFQAAG